MRFFTHKSVRTALVPLLVVALCIPTTFLLLPVKTADAQIGCLSSLLGTLSGLVDNVVGGLTAVPVFDATVNSHAAKTDIATTYEQQKDGCLDGLAWLAAKFLIQELTSSLVNWINSGFNGNPAFINDPTGFFMDMGDQVAGAFIAGQGLGFLCDPISMGIDIRAALALNYFGSYSGAGGIGACRLSQIIGNVENARVFVNGSFNVSVSGQVQSGWTNWLATTQIPQNNIYGSYMMAEDEMNAQVAGSVSINGKVLDWGHGFQSQLDASGLISTPGDFIDSQLQAAGASPQHSLEVADEIDEMIGAVAGALMNQVMSKGLSSLSGGSNGNVSYTSSLRNSNPAESFYNPTQTQIDQWGASSNSTYNDTAAQNIETAYNNTVSLLQSQYGVTQTPKISLFGYDADETPCISTVDVGNGSVQTFPASNAIDGAMTTYSNTSCGSASKYANWEVHLAPAEYLSEVKINLLSTNWLLAPFTLASGAQSPTPYLQLLDTNNVWHNVALNQTDTFFDLVLGNDTSGINLQNLKFQTVRITSGNYVVLAEVSLFRQLNPVVNARNVPLSLPAATANVAPGFSPFGPTDNWVTATYFPSNVTATPPLAGYNNPTPLSTDTIVVTVQDSTKTTTFPPSSTAPLMYVLPAGNYVITYTVTDPLGITSAPATRNITVVQ